MDEKVSAPDSGKFWMETDSLRTQHPEPSGMVNPSSWVTGTAVVVAVTLVLIILFNSRTK